MSRRRPAVVVVAVAVLLLASLLLACGGVSPSPPGATTQPASPTPGKPVGTPVPAGPKGGTATPSPSATPPALATQTPIPPTPPPPTATMEPSPRPNGVLISADDFDDPSGGAQALYGSEFMTFDYVDGEGRLTTKSQEDILPAMYGAPSVSDFFADFDFRAASAPPKSGYGLIFRSDDAPGGLGWYYQLLIIPADGYARLSCWKDGATVVNQHHELPPGLVALTATNHVRLEALGSQFRVFVNGAFAFEAGDTTLTAPGILGLSASSGIPEADTVYFDNLRVYSAS